MNLILIGYRGTGKSTVARLLATWLGLKNVSTDAMIIEKAKFPIPDIVAKFGWDHFRDLETLACQELQGLDNLVIDTGGGIILRNANIQSLKPSGVICWLTANVETISRRIANDDQRPALTSGKDFIEEIKEVLHKRTPKYEAAADFIVETDSCSVDQVANQVLNLFRKAQGLEN